MAFRCQFEACSVFLQHQTYSSLQGSIGLICFSFKAQAPGVSQVQAAKIQIVSDAACREWSNFGWKPCFQICLDRRLFVPGGIGCGQGSVWLRASRWLLLFAVRWRFREVGCELSLWLPSGRSDDEVMNYFQSILLFGSLTGKYGCCRCRRKDWSCILAQSLLSVCLKPELS